MNTIQTQLLNLLSNALFNTNYPISADSIDAVLTESTHQAVTPLVYSVVKGTIGEVKGSTGVAKGSSGVAKETTQLKDQYKKIYNHYIRHNLQIEYQHTEVDRLMSANNIPYVILKGCASGRYYPDPMLRCYGDVDFLVGADDFDGAKAVLEAEGFKAEEDKGGIHVAFHRGADEVWELHRSINGIPTGKTGEVVNGIMNSTISTSIKVQGNSGSYRVPDDFHHCFILLLHTASHLTSEGIGLRHLCDWAVFVNKVDVEQWKDELESCGLWRFAQILTAVSSQYLGLPEQAWVEPVDDALLFDLIVDVLDSGNFGHKDSTRPQQIKYISNRGEKRVSSSSPIVQVMHTIKVKAETEGKSRVRIVAEYVGLIMYGKRKLDNKRVLDEAAKRKKIYSEFRLFE